MSRILMIKRKNPDLPITIETMERVKAAIKSIGADEYKVENVNGRVIKSIVDSRIKTKA